MSEANVSESPEAATPRIIRKPEDPIILEQLIAKIAEYKTRLHSIDDRSEEPIYLIGLSFAMGSNMGLDSYCRIRLLEDLFAQGSIEEEGWVEQMLKQDQVLGYMIRPGGVEDEKGETAALIEHRLRTATGVIGLYSRGESSEVHGGTGLPSVMHTPITE